MNRICSVIAAALALVFAFSIEATPTFAAAKASAKALTAHENLGDWYDIG
jgi:hypothetical protein